MPDRGSFGIGDSSDVTCFATALVLATIVCHAVRASCRQIGEMARGRALDNGQSKRRLSLYAKTEMPHVIKESSLALAQ